MSEGGYGSKGVRLFITPWSSEPLGAGGTHSTLHTRAGPRAGFGGNKYLVIRITDSRTQGARHVTRARAIAYCRQPRPRSLAGTKPEAVQI